MHTLLWTAAVLVGVFALAWAHTAFWGWYLRPRSGPDETFFVTTVDGVRIAIGHHNPRPTRRYAEPVILCHGLGANRLNLDFDEYSLARRLSERGYEVFVVEVRGIGLSPASRKEKAGFTFDDFALKDAPAALAEALARAGARRAFWVGHSMGGMIGYVLGQGIHATQLAGLVAIASPTTWSRQTYLLPIVRFARWLARMTWLDRQSVYIAVAPLAGHVQPRITRLIARTENIDGHVARRLVAHNTAPIHPGVMLQFAGWIEQDRFCSIDGRVDYRAGLSHFAAPVLLIAGTDDRMAPPGAVEDVFQAMGSQDKNLLLFGRQHGHSSDYGHGDLVFGRRAPDEIFPALMGWLEKRATPASPEAPKHLPGKS